MSSWRSQQGDRLIAVRSDQALGDRRPHRQLDQLPVQQPQPGGRVERRGGDEQRQRDRLARPRLAAHQHVALHQPDRHRLAVLVDPERDRVPQRERLSTCGRPRQRLRVVDRVTPHQRQSGERRVGPLCLYADLAHAQARRQLRRAGVERRQ
jgi:hypothetical protein